MSNFCNQCAKQYDLPEGDFKFIRKDEKGNEMNLAEGEGWFELCEGCGPTAVDNDGNCLGLCDNPQHTK